MKNIRRKIAVLMTMSFMMITAVSTGKNHPTSINPDETVTDSENTSPITLDEYNNLIASMDESMTYSDADAPLEDNHSHSLLESVGESLFTTASAAGQPVSNGVYILESALNRSKAVDVFNNNKTNGTKIELWDKNSGAAQQFHLVWCNAGYYYIYHAVSGKVLDVQSGTAKNGTKVILYQYNGGKNQRWILQYAGGGYYYIKSALGNYYLDVVGGKTANGTQIQIYQGNKTASQKFYLRDTSTNKNYTMKISTPTSIQDWFKKMKQAEQKMLGLGQLVYAGDGKTRYYNGWIIKGAKVLKYAKVKVQVSVQGPTKDGKSPTRTVYMNLPVEIQYTLHKHNISLETSWRQIGNILTAIGSATFTATYSCTCGLCYHQQWEMPSDDQIMKAANGQSLYVNISTGPSSSISSGK